MIARDLLANATPRPWLAVLPYGGVVSTDPAALVKGSQIRGARHVRAYGGALVCKSASPSDKALIVAAVNEYEALLDIALAAEWARDCRDEDALVDQFEAAMDAAQLALARLDAVRGGT